MRGAKSISFTHELGPLLLLVLLLLVVILYIHWNQWSICDEPQWKRLAYVHQGGQRHIWVLPVNLGYFIIKQIFDCPSFFCKLV